MTYRLIKRLLSNTDANRKPEIEIALPAESVYPANKLDVSTDNLDGVANLRSARDIGRARRGD